MSRRVARSVENHRPVSSPAFVAIRRQLSLPGPVRDAELAAAPDDPVAEPARHPEHRQKEITKNPGDNGSAREMPARRIGEERLGAIPDGSEPARARPPARSSDRATLRDPAAREGTRRNRAPRERAGQAAPSPARRPYRRCSYGPPDCRHRNTTLRRNSTWPSPRLDGGLTGPSRAACPGLAAPRFRGQVGERQLRLWRAGHPP